MLWIRLENRVVEHEYITYSPLTPTLTKCSTHLSFLNLLHHIGFSWVLLCGKGRYKQEQVTRPVLTPSPERASERIRIINNGIT